MPGQAVQNILDYRNLARAFQRTSAINAPLPFYDFYNRAPAETPTGVDRIEMIRTPSTRKPAPINFPGSPAKTMDTVGLDRVYFSPVHVFNEISIPEAALDNLRQENSQEMQERGAEELTRQMRIFSQRHRLTRVTFLSKALTDGVVYYNNNGEILESSSGAAVTCDLGVGATHKAQLAHASNGGSDIIGTRWDQAGALILTDMEQIEQAAEWDQTAPPRHVWLNSLAKAWFRTNTEIKSFITTNLSARAEEFLGNFRDDTLQLGRYTFHFTNATYEATDGSVKPIIPLNRAVITPDVTEGDWFARFECNSVIPTSTGIVNGVGGYTSNTRKVAGEYAYASLVHNPIKLSMFLGMRFLYAFRDPQAVWMPTVGT